ncbi:MAG TPA: CNNM domain-containing protein [Phycisphaerales bacterium]|nr:CNNM domain-containing protein [Phycisphaerales bacterium]HMP36220.1 CNNM domain-containing protein [Phycisphaerales bacterium]
MTIELLPWFCVALAGLALSALFSGIETGLYSLNRVRLAVRAGRGEPSAKRLRDELAAPGRLLSTILIGNNIANYLGSLGVAMMLHRSEIGQAGQVIVGVIVLVPLLFVFGETLPKDLFRTFADSWSYRWSGYLRAWRIGLTAIGLVPTAELVGASVARALGSSTEGAPSARARISQLFREGAGAGVLSERQATLVDRALTLRERTVESQMTPWRRVLWLPEASRRPASELIPRVRPVSRLPVVDHGGRVVGVVATIESLCEPTRTVSQLMTPATTLPPRMPILDAIRTLRLARTKIGIVVDSGGRPIGVATMSDLVAPFQ